jgi:hypothetical protein
MWRKFSSCGCQSTGTAVLATADLHRSIGLARICVVVVVVVFTHCRLASNESGPGSGLYRSRRVTNVVHEFAAANKTITKISANHFTAPMQSKAREPVNAGQMWRRTNILRISLRDSFVIRHLCFVISRCAMSILRRNFLSVRGYGLRTDEPRQGRNAATVV